MKTDTYTIGELQEFLESEKYKHSKILPVSPERVASYIENPRAGQNMPVLFTISENDQIIAYRTLLPDHLNTRGDRVSFAWLSGNYVSPDQRRRGLSTKLFKTVEEAWQGKLMYTNYAPASKAVYDKSGVFEEFAVRPGKRYYMRSSLQSLYKERIGSASLLSFLDRLINGIHDAQLYNLAFDYLPGIQLSGLDTIDSQVADLIKQAVPGSLFGRDTMEFEWIRKFPWVTLDHDQSLPGHYQFTRIADRFKNLWFKIEMNGAIAFLWISILNEKLSVPYFFHNDPMLIVAARQLVLNTMLEYRAAYLSVRHPELGPVLGTRKNPFLISRDMPQHYFAHKELKELIPTGKLIHDGDGDCVFT